MGVPFEPEEIEKIRQNFLKEAKSYKGIGGCADWVFWLSVNTCSGGFEQPLFFTLNIPTVLV